MTDARWVWGIGLATISANGTILDTWFPEPKTGRLPLGYDPSMPPEDLERHAVPDPRRGVDVEVVTVEIDLDESPASTPDAYLRLHALSHRREKVLPGPAHAAADHDQLRLEDVDDRGEAAGERLHGLVPYPRGTPISAQRRAGDLLRRSVPEARLAGALSDRRPRDVRLEAAATAAAAACAPAPVDRHMAELRAVPKAVRTEERRAA